MSFLHARLANSVLFYLLALSLWGFWRTFRKQGVNSSYWGALVIAELLVLTQVVLGGLMSVNGMTPARGWIHILYGIVGVIGIPAVYLFTNGRDDRREMLVYAATLLFLVGITLRAITTGGP